jgi:hypothetical protein
LKVINFAAFLFIILSTDVYSSGILGKKDPAVYYITAKAVVANNGIDLNKLILIFPLPQSNEYQDIEITDIGNAEILNLPLSEDKYIRFTMENTDLPQKNQKKIITFSFKATLYSIKINFDNINEIYPYDRFSLTYKLYTKNNGKYIDPNNAKIKKIGNTLWSKSSDYLDYARNCYEYTADELKYQNPNTGIHPLDKIISNGGGDCGNFALFFINLLRYKGIPSRFLNAKNPDNSTHVWADFYLEKYGWIPVDVTYKNSDKNGNYFGNISDHGIIMTKGVNFDVEIGKNEFIKLDILQNYAWAYKYSNSVSAKGKIQIDFNFNINQF